MLAGAMIFTSAVAVAEDVTGILLGGTPENTYPIPQAEVKICPGNSANGCKSAYTDSEGFFRFPGISPGPYSLKAESSTGGVTASQIEVQPGQDVSIEIRSP